MAMNLGKRIAPPRFIAFALIARFQVGRQASQAASVAALDADVVCGSVAVDDWSPHAERAADRQGGDSAGTRSACDVPHCSSSRCCDPGRAPAVSSRVRFPGV